MNFRLPQKDSATWRSLITSVESTIVLLSLLASMPEVRDYITQNYPQALPEFVVGLSVLNFLRNFLRKDVKNY